MRSAKTFLRPLANYLNIFKIVQEPDKKETEDRKEFREETVKKIFSLFAS